MNKSELMKTANEIRKSIVTAVHAAKSGHPGGSLSAADIYTYLYFEELNIDPKDPKKADLPPSTRNLSPAFLPALPPAKATERLLGVPRADGLHA